MKINGKFDNYVAILIVYKLLDFSIKFIKIYLTDPLICCILFWDSTIKLIN